MTDRMALSVILLCTFAVVLLGCVPCRDEVSTETPCKRKVKLLDAQDGLVPGSLRRDEAILMAIDHQV